MVEVLLLAVGIGGLSQFGILARDEIKENKPPEGDAEGDRQNQPPAMGQCPNCCRDGDACEDNAPGLAPPGFLFPERGFCHG